MYVLFRANNLVELTKEQNKKEQGWFVGLTLYAPLSKPTLFRNRVWATTNLCGVWQAGDTLSRRKKHWHRTCDFVFVFCVLIDCLPSNSLLIIILISTRQKNVRP